MARRRGAGKIRHIETRTLCLQRKITNKEIELRREPGATIVSDLGTKHLSGPDMRRIVAKLGFTYRKGQSDKALKAELSGFEGCCTRVPGTCACADPGPGNRQHEGDCEQVLGTCACADPGPHCRKSPSGSLSATGARLIRKQRRIAAFVSAPVCTAVSACACCCVCRSVRVYN